MNPSYRKEVLGLCVLSLLQQQDRCGHEIAELLSQRVEITNSSLYSILRRLEADRLLASCSREAGGGSSGKRYSLTDLGREVFLTDRRKYLQFSDSVHLFLAEDPDSDT